MSPHIKRPGYYPLIRDSESLVKTKIQIGNTQSFLFVTYTSDRAINIYIGGPEKWCIHCELIRKNNQIQPLGYLIKLRYDILCSLEHGFAKGYDTKQLVYFLIQYIYNTYPSVKELLFNDLSTRYCDNNYDINLAVMTYLYTEKTWYEKNFGAYISPQSQKEWERIKCKYNKAKHDISWEIMNETIRNNDLSEMSDVELEELYNTTKTWKDFFESIYKKMEIADFCIFLSGWIDSFICKYFNNLQGLTFLIPIKDYNIIYTESEYKQGGRKYTRKTTRKHFKDYK